ncbi:MAG: type II toxin-antitoxin system YhaV family toxin [Salinarimonas sp.]
MSAPAAPLTVNSWSIYAHPLFLDQLDGLIEEVEALKARNPKGWQRKSATKRLAAIFKLVSDVIPAEPGSPAFRQGDSLGPARRHWFRAKFFQQYRLFFRFDSASKVIVLAWVNDDETLRSYGSRSDAYATFKGMFENGNPPEDFDALLRAARRSGGRFTARLEAASQPEPRK